GRVPRGRAEQGRHPAAGDVVVRAEAVVLWGVAAAGDVGCAEPVDVTFEDAVVVVVEVVAASGVRVAQRPNQECRHLSTGHVVVGTETIIVRRVTAAWDALVGQPFDVVFEDAVVVVDERVGPAWGASWLAVIGRI